MMNYQKPFLLAAAGLLVLALRPGLAQPMPWLGDAPLAPKDVSGLPRRVKQLSVNGGFAVNPASREEIRLFYNAVYKSSDGIPLNSTASVAACTPGTNGAAFLEAELRRINWLRAYAGVPANINFLATNNIRDQQAAVMMSKNNALSHSPPGSWTCYTSDGCTAANNSNLALGYNGPESIAGYMWDFGVNNNVVGHRRWILYPQTQVMGAGDVSAQDPYYEANALWVIDGHYFDPRPSTRSNYVAWPPPGYAPYPLVFPRWSFSYANANFTNATITMRSNGVLIATSKEAVRPNIGENTVAWVPMGLDPNSQSTVFPFNGTDTVYTVAISNIVGMPQTWYTYTVTVFDPAVPGADSFPPIISGPDQPHAGAANAYTFNAVPNATSYQWRSTLRTPHSLADGAESDIGNFFALTSGGYSARVAGPTYPVASGSYAFNLHHPDSPSADSLTLMQAFVPASNATLSFKSRLTWAASDEFAKVQVSTNDGSTWTDVYSQQGVNAQGETTFTVKSLSLAAFAGKTTQLRFNYYFLSGSYYAWTDPGDGWTFDAIVLTNAEVWTPLNTNATATTTFTFTPSQAGNYNLEARALIFTEFPLDWGPLKQVTAISNNTPAIVLSRPLLTNSQVWVNFTLQSGSAATFKLLQADQPQGPWTTNLSATLTTNTPGVSYRYTATPAGNAKFYRVKTP